MSQPNILEILMGALISYSNMLKQALKSFLSFDITQLANMQDHIGWTTDHMNSLKSLCSEQPPPEIFVMVSTQTCK